MKLKETLLNHEISLGIRRTIRFFFSVLILFNLVVPTWASEVSLRVKGMGRELAGIVSDSETDILKNPARLMELEKREVLAVFEPRSSSKSRGIRNPTLSLKGFFPSFISSKIGFGFWGEGAKQQLSDGSVRKEKYGSSWSGEPYILEYEISRTSTRGSEKFLGKPFFSWSPSPRIRFGISYEYDIESTENQRESETRRIEFDPFTFDTVRVDQSILDVKDDIAQTSHIVRLGTAFDLSDRTFLELLGQLTISQDDSTNDYTSERLAFWESSWVRTWSNSNGNYIDSTYNSRNSVDKNVKNRNPLLDSQQFSVGFKLSREISDATTMRFIGSVSRGTGDLSGRNDEISEVKDEEYSFRYIESETETTTVIYGDTLLYLSQDNGSITGDWDLLSASAALGLERRVSNRVLLGVALKGLYSQDVTDRREKGTLYIRSDTTASETTFVEVGEDVTDKMTRTIGVKLSFPSESK